MQVSSHVLAVPVEPHPHPATVVNVPGGMTEMRVCCAEDLWMLRGQELAEVPTGPINDGSVSAFIPARESHVREVAGGMRLSFTATARCLASIEFA